MEHRTKWKAGMVLFGTLLAVVALVAWLTQDGQSKVTPAAAATPPTTVSPQQLTPAEIAALTVTTTSVDCPTVVAANGGSTLAVNGQTIVKFVIGALAPVAAGGRKWSDALSTPFTQTDPTKMLGEIQAALCEDPLLGSTVANSFANLKVGDVSVVGLNSWLQPFAGDPSTINATAAGFIPLLDVSNPAAAQQSAAVTQNLAWQAVAEKLGTLLTRFQLVGVTTEKSVLNYHLVVGGLVVGGLPAVGLDSDQDSLPALELDLTDKNACVPILKIGFNVGDKRPEQFATPTCAPPAPPAKLKPPAPQPPASVPPNVVTTTVPGTVVTTVPPHSTTTVPPHSTTTVPPVVTTVPPPATTVPPCSGSKCHVATTTPPPPVTQAPPPATVPNTVPPNGGGQNSNPGATNTTTPPSTVAPPVTQPVTTTPTAPASPPPTF